MANLPYQSTALRSNPYEYDQPFDPYARNLQDAIDARPALTAANVQPTPNMGERIGNFAASALKPFYYVPAALPGLMNALNTPPAVRTYEDASGNQQIIPESAAPAPARQNTAPLPAREDRARGEPYVTAAQAAAPKAGDVVGSPMEVVRGLQRTNYLPVLDTRGNVSYQSEDFMKQQAADKVATKLAQVKQEADIAETLSKREKNLRVPAMDQATLMRLAKVPTLQAVMESPNSTENQRKAARSEMDIIWNDLYKTEAIASVLRNLNPNTED